MPSLRATFLTAAAIALVALPASGKDDPPRKRSVPRTAEFQRGVDQAIDRGVAWLKKAQERDGGFADFPTFPGATTALAYLTLRTCDVPADDAAAKKAWDALLRAHDRGSLQTYSAALYLMAIEAHGQRDASARDDRDVTLTAKDRKLAEEIVRALTAAQDRDGGWSYALARDRYVRGPRQEASYHDHSNMQYALLGLKSAARCGISIDGSVWRSALEHLLASQETSGPLVQRGADAAPAKRGSTSARIDDRARGWGYRDEEQVGRGVYASMTAGGVSSVVICRSELLGTRAMTSRLEEESERSAWDGLAWLGTNWEPGGELTMKRAGIPDGLPPEVVEKVREQLRALSKAAPIDAYEFYAVERAGVLAGVAWMADLDWYGVGAEVLVEHQSKDGSWRGRGGGLMTGDQADRDRAMQVVDTCFALLFLRRGTTPVTRGAVTQARDDTDINWPDAPGTLSDKDFQDLLDLVLLRWRRSTDDGVRARLLDGATALGPRIVEPLLVALDAADAAERAAALALLRRATGREFGLDADAEPGSAPHESAVLAWQMWWMESKARLRYDPTARRLVAD